MFHVIRRLFGYSFSHILCKSAYGAALFLLQLISDVQDFDDVIFHGVTKYTTG